MPLNFGGVANRNSEYTVSCASAQGVQCNNLNSGNASVTFTGGAGGANASATATLTITGIEDNVEEGNESVTVSLGTLDANSGTNLDGGASGSGLSSGSVNFNLSETPTIAFERDNYEVTEGDTVDVVVLVLSQELEGWVIGSLRLRVRDRQPKTIPSWDSESILVGSNLEIRACRYRCQPCRTTATGTETRPSAWKCGTLRNMSRRVQEATGC